MGSDAPSVWASASGISPVRVFSVQPRGRTTSWAWTMRRSRQGPWDRRAGIANELASNSRLLQQISVRGGSGRSADLRRCGPRRQGEREQLRLGDDSQLPIEALAEGDHAGRGDAE